MTQVSCMVCGKAIEPGTGDDHPLAGFYCSFQCKQNHKSRLDNLWLYFMGGYGSSLAQAIMEDQNGN